MADNVTLPGTGEVTRTIEKDGVDVQVIAIDLGGAGAESLLTTSMPIQDGGNTITVDGTVTAELSATDNAVLDAIAASVGTIDNAIGGSEMQVDVITMPVTHVIADSGTISTITNVVHVDDNTGSLTVDGTVTANLSATDNAVLDAVAASLATIDDITQPLTDTELRADPVPVSGTVTANLSATDNAVLDNIQTSVDALAATITETKLQVDVITMPEGGSGLTDAELRADAVVVSLDGETVDISGTITAELSAEDNSVLDAIQAAVETIDDAISGSEMQVDVLTTPASIDNSGAVYAGANCTPKFAAISAASSGNNTLVAAVADKKIRVLSLSLVASDAVNAKLQSGASGTDLTGLYYLSANGGFILPYSKIGWFETGSNTLLNLNLSGAVAVGGCLTYIEV